MKNVVGVCVVVTVFGAISACITTKQGYVSKGNKLFDAGKYEDAALNYKKAIQRDPNYGEAYYRLGLVSIKLKRGSEAYDSLFRAVRLLPGNVAAKEKLADVCLGMYLADSRHPKVLYDQLQQLAKELLDTNADSHEGLIVKGYLADLDGHPKEAISLLSKATQGEDADPGVKTQLVLLLINDGQIQEAEKQAHYMMDVQKSSFDKIYGLMYNYYYQHNRVADAEDVLKTLVRNDPKHATHILDLARHYARVGKSAEMKSTLQRILDNPKDFPQGAVWVGNFYVVIRDYSDAIATYDAAARSHANPKERAVYQDRIMFTLLAEGKDAEATQMAESLLKQDPANETALRLRADEWLASGKADKVDAAIHTVEGLLEKHPNDPALRFLSGQGYKLRGNLDAARAQYQEAAKRKDFLRPRYELVELDLLQQRQGDALQQASEILAIKPGDPRGTLLHARTLEARGDLAGARRELNDLAKASPQYGEAVLELGVIAVKENKVQDGIAAFEKVSAMGELRGALALAELYQSQKQYDQSIRVLREASKKWPDSATILLHLGSVEAISGNYAAAIDSFQKLLALDPKSVQAKLHLGDVYELQGDHTNALLWYRQASDSAPNDRLLALTLADALARAGRTAEARNLYEGIIKLHPDDPTALNNLAFFLADTGGDLTEALDLATRANAKQARDEFAVADTIGYIYLKKGQRDSAVQAFRNLVRQKPKVAAFHYHLAMALFEKGDKGGARKELRDALANHPSREDESRIKDLLSKIG